MSSECCADGLGLGTIVTPAPATAASIAALSSSTLFKPSLPQGLKPPVNFAALVARLKSCPFKSHLLPALSPDHHQRIPNARVRRRLKIVLAKFGNRKFALCFRIQVARAVFAGQRLIIDFLLQRD